MNKKVSKFKIFSLLILVISSLFLVSCFETEESISEQIKKVLDKVSIEYATNNSSDKITDNFVVPIEISGITIEWLSSNEEVLVFDNDTAMITRLEYDVEVYITAQVTIDKITDFQTFKIKIIGIPLQEVGYQVMFYIDNEQYGQAQYVKEGSSAKAPTPPNKEGYDFIGWDQEFSNVEADLAINGIYSPIEYTISYTDLFNTNHPNQTTYTIEDEFVLLSPSIRHGYTFIGWYQGNEKIDKISLGTTDNIILSARFEKNTYLVKFVDYDLREIKTEFVQHGSPAIAPLNPTRVGYTFKGWKQPFNSVTSDITIEAEYSINTYKITYQVKDQNDIVQYFEYDSSIIGYKPDQIVGYSFSWDKPIPQNMPPRDLVFIGTYTPNQYKITYLVDGEEHLVREYDFGEPITITPDLIKEGYSFSWNPTTLPTTMPANDLEVNGSFTINTFTVTFVDYDDWVIDTQTINWNESAIAPTDPERIGYDFSGWDVEFSNITKDITVKAKYSTNQYTIRLVLDNGEDDIKITQNYDTPITSPTEPTKEGYEFIGWDPALPSTMPSEDRLHTAQWEVKQYTVTYVVEGEEYVVDTYDFGVEISIRDLLEEEGYSFIWEPTVLPETMPAKNLVVTGTFTINTYTVTFVDFNDDVIDTQTINWNEAATAPTDPERTGYQFTGWDVDFSNVKKDLTVKAKYNVNQYTITYLVDGEEHLVREYDFGEPITITPDLIKEGYSFSWNPQTLPETMPANDLEVIGTFTINTFTVKFVDHDDKVLDTQTIIWKESATAPTDPERTGYQFTGWGVDFSNVTKDLTVKAKYSINQYTITYLVDGEEHLVREYDFGEPITITPDLIKEGYSFSWNPTTLPTTMPANDLEVIGVFTINTYTVKFIDYDDMVIDTQTINWNESATAPTDPERTGYQFTGWGVDFSNVTKDLTVKAQFSAIKYSVTYVVDGEIYDFEIYDFGTEISIRPLLEKEGYTFSWNPQTLPATMPANDLEVIGLFTINTYTVIFVDFDDRFINTQTIIWNESATAPTEPERTGYQFTGWDVDFSNVKKDLTVKAKYSINQYTITLVLDNGEVNIEITQDYDTEVLPTKPTKEGHKFIGWNPILPSTMPAQDKTHTAQWEVNQYNVTYIVEDEENIVDTYYFDEEIKMPLEPTKDGYSFIGWFTNENLTEEFTLSKMPANNINLFAKWTALPVITLNLYDDKKILIYQEPGTELTVEEPTRTGYEFTGWNPALPSTMPSEDGMYTAQWDVEQYTVTYVVDGLDNIVKEYDFGEPITIIQDLVKEGYSFGWNPKVLPETMPAENLVVNGAFTINTYTVTFVDFDDRVIDTQTINWNESATAPIDPERVGYDFARWDVEFNNITKDLTVKAIYNINQYTITLVLDNGEVNIEITQDYDTEVSPTEPTKEGHKFIGWNPTLPSTMPAQDKTHTAQWEVKQYNIEYVVDGETYAFDIYDFGKEIIIPIDPTKEGHTFNGWDNELPTTMPAENIVLTAVWEINKFDVTFDVGESQTINYKHHINYDEVPNALDVNSQWFGFEFYGWSIDGSENIISRDYEVTENIHLTARFIKHITQADIVNNNRFDIDDTSIDQIIYKSKISNQEMPTNGIYAYLSFNALTGIVLIDYKLPSGSLTSNYLTINDKTIASSSNDDWRTAKFINNYNEELKLGFYKQGTQNEGSETLISNIRIIVGEVYNTQFNVYEHNGYGYGQLEVPSQPYLLGQIVEITTTPDGEAAFVGFQVNQSWVYGNGDEVIHETIHGLEVTQNNIEFIAYFKQYIALSEMSATINPGEIKENTISVLSNTTLQIVEDVDNLTILFNIIDKDPLVKLVIKNNGLEILSTFDETFELEFDATKRFNQIEVVFEKDNFIKRAITFEVLVFSSTKGLTNDRNINILNDLYYPYEKNDITNEYISTNGKIKENNISLLKLEVDVKNPLGGIFQFDFKLHTLKSENQHILIVYIGEDRPVDATNSETRDSDLYTGVTSWQTYQLALDYGKHTIYVGYYRVWDERLTHLLDNLEIKNIWLDDGTEELSLDFDTQGGDVLVNGNTYDYNNNRYDRGAELELMPNPNANHTFIYWIDFDGNIIYDWQITVLLDESKYYQAVFVNTEIYKFRIGTDVYTSLEEAVSNSIYGDVLILLGKQYTLDYNITIPEGVSLLIPLNEKDYQGFNIEIVLTNTTEYYNPHGVVLGKEKLYATFIINEGVTLTVNGFVYVNAITGRNQGGTQVQNISGDYSQIELNGKIIVSQTGTLESAGKIYGSGEIEVLQGGNFGETFVVRGWRGGSQAENQFGSLNMNGAFPFNEYEMPYVTTTIKVHSGASYYGLVKMYALSRFYATRFNQFNDTKGLIQLNEGAFAIIEKQVNKNVLVEAKQYTDVLVRATITINGGATEIGGSLKVAGLSASTASMESFYPINGNITLNLENGDYVLNHNLKFLTGSILNIKENATLLINKIPKVKPLDKEINSMVAFYDEYIDRVTGETSYPDRPAAELNLFGKLIIKGAMSGTITAYNGSTVETSADAIFELSPGEANGWMSGFYNYHTVLRISPVNGDIIEEITAGEVYNF